MNVRKQRTHQCGISNLDFRTKRDFQNIERFQGDMSKTNFGFFGRQALRTMRSTVGDVTPKEKLKITSGFQVPVDYDPRTFGTKQFYEQQNKPMNKSMYIPSPHLGGGRALLEKPIWSDKIFTGDIPGDERWKNRKLSKLHEPIPKFDMAKIKSQSVEPMALESFDSYRFVPLARKETLEGRVDMDKLKRIRQMLRRRYTNKSNVMKVYHEWDQSGKGFVDERDIHTMVNSLGIQLNKDQARVLLASADHNADAKLKIQEFKDLIFNENKTINLDLGRLAPSSKQFDSIASKVGLPEGIGSKQEAEQRRNQTQLRYFVKKNINPVMTELAQADDKKTGRLDFKNFKRVIQKRVPIPEYIRKDQKLLEDLFMEQKPDQRGTINYADFATRLTQVSYNPFSFDDTSNLAVAPPSSHGLPSAARSTKFGALASGEGRSIDEQDFQILNTSTQPLNQLEKIQQKALKVTRQLQREFKNMGALEEKLKGTLSIDKNGAVERADVQKFFVDECKDLLVNKTIDKKDIEGFLSSLNYNVHGATKLNQIAPRLFGNSLRYDIFKKATRAAPPKPIDTSFDYQSPTSKEGQAKLRELLDELEQKVFKSKTTHFKVFHAFDQDNDGFVSLQDVKTHLKKMQISASEQQVTDLFKHLDTNKNGFLDFNDFSHGVHSRMGDDYEPPNAGVPDTSKRMPGVVNSPKEQQESPTIKQTDRSQPQNRRAASWQPDQTAHIRGAKVKDNFLEIKKQFEPDRDLMIKPIHYTRFTSRPPHQNTFANYHASEDSAIFVSEKVRQKHDKQNRLNRTTDPNVTVAYQREEKEKKQRIADARVSRLRETQDIFLKSVQATDSFLASRDMNRVFNKTQTHSAYQQVGAHYLQRLNG